LIGGRGDYDYSNEDAKEEEGGGGRGEGTTGKIRRGTEMRGRTSISRSSTGEWMIKYLFQNHLSHVFIIICMVFKKRIFVFRVAHGNNNIKKNALLESYLIQTSAVKE
jgi:hypothetical protein